MINKEQVVTIEVVTTLIYVKQFVMYIFLAVEVNDYLLVVCIISATDWVKFVYMTPELLPW